MQGDPTKAEGGQQVFSAGEIAAAGHLGHCLTIEQGIEAIAAELALEHLGAALEVIFAVAGFIPVANAITGRGGSHEIEPVEAWVGRLGGNHLHEVTVLQRSGERGQAIVDAHALAVITDFRVDAIGEIYGRRTLTQTHHIAIGSEYKHLLVKQIFFDRAQEVVAVGAAVILLPINQLTQPVEALGIGSRCGRRTALLVFPMGGNAVFGHLVHIGGANLHFDRPVAADHRRMQGLVAIGLG